MEGRTGGVGSRIGEESPGSFLCGSKERKGKRFSISFLFVSISVWKKIENGRIGGSHRVFPVGFLLLCVSDKNSDEGWSKRRWLLGKIS